MDDIQFDVEFRKDGQEFKETIFVEKFEDLRNPYPEFDELNYNPGVYGKEALDNNDKTRIDMIESIENKVLAKAQEKFGKNLSGLKVDIRPNYNNKADDEKMVKESLDIAKDSSPELFNNAEELKKLRHEVEQSLILHKKEQSYYFPGNDGVEISGNPNPFLKPNAFLKTAIENKIEALQNTEKVIIDANRNISNAINGYELTHNIRDNEKSYFIVMKKADGQEMVKSTIIENSLSTEDKQAFIKSNAKDFVYKNTSILEDLKNVDVRVEKANDLSDLKQREFYKEIGHNEYIKGLQNSFEIGK